MYKIVFAVLLTAMMAKADSSSEFGDISKISNASFRNRLSIKGEVFILDSSGKRLVGVLPEERIWKLGPKSEKIQSKWSVKANEIKPVILNFDAEVKNDNSISFSVKQVDSSEKVLREKNFVLQNFAPMSWVAETSEQYQVVVRITPQIDSSREVENIEKIPIGGDRNNFQVTDNQGYLWADNVRFGGVFAGLKSHRGTFLISLYPFKGAKEIGTAFRKTILLEMNDKLTVKVTSDTDIVPGEMKTKVYGIYLPDLKMTTPLSAHSIGQSNFDHVPKEFVVGK